MVAYLDGIRGFIPASKLSLNYVEEDALNDWLGKELEVRVINADAENKRLVLSAREILREKADEERKAKVSNDGKLSLSMKALNDVAAEEVEEETFELPETEAATTSLGSLFKNIKL